MSAIYPPATRCACLALLWLLGLAGLGVWAGWHGEGRLAFGGSAKGSEPGSQPDESLELLSREQLPWDIRRPGANPRPEPRGEHVPLRTSFYMLIGHADDIDDPVIHDSIRIELEAESGESRLIVQPPQRFAEGYRGGFVGWSGQQDGPSLRVYIEGDADRALKPETTYTLRVEAESESGAVLSEEEGTWTFTTEQAPQKHEIERRMDLAAGPDVHWHGEFFNGFARPSFMAGLTQREPHYQLMAEARQRFAHAWNLHRDAYLAGFEHRRNPFKAYPNIVRERETRRITSIRRTDAPAELELPEGADADEPIVVLEVEDFFGHEQYGIESDRPLSEDYHFGDEVLIADGAADARAYVIDVDDETRTVRLTAFEDPDAGWQIEYPSPLPREEDPDAPGLFPPGGTYLRKFDPHGTAHYYFGRLNHLWDRLHGEYGFRVIPRFASAPGDLAIDGRNGTTAKDLAQLHEVTYQITSHIIDRYGDAALEWPWVVHNEPDLMSLYWRNRDWEELQRFYDYTSDAILRAFEDHGYDSHEVQVGGLELGAIVGTNMRLEEFLTHVSPDATGEGALEHNAAYKDPRLDGRRSQRVEELCEAHDGRGAPFDFLSIHNYDDAELASEKLIHAKRVALEIDPEYFQTLPIVNHETVPGWRRIQDPGAAEMYLGNGYYPTWCLHLQSRLLQQGARDARYAYGGESPLMCWPGIVNNFDTLNDLIRQIHLEDRTEVIPNPIHHVLNLLSTMREAFYVLEPERIGGHELGGFAAATEDDFRLVVYSHNLKDTQSRSDISFRFTLELASLGQELDAERVRVTEYRFDRERNSYYPLARELRPDQPQPTEQFLRIHETYSEQQFERVAQQATQRPTSQQEHALDADESLELELDVAGNGLNFVIIEPAD